MTLSIIHPYPPLLPPFPTQLTATGHIISYQVPKHAKVFCCRQEQSPPVRSESHNISPNTNPPPQYPAKTHQGLIGVESIFLIQDCRFQYSFPTPAHRQNRQGASREPFLKKMRIQTQKTFCIPFQINYITFSPTNFVCPQPTCRPVKSLPAKPRKKEIQPF